MSKHTKHSNHVVIYPTDTVWGIGCSIFSHEGYLRIANIKQTTDDKPVSVLFSSVDHLITYLDVGTYISPSVLEKLFSMEVTIGIPLIYFKKEIPSWICATSNIVGVRVIPSLKNVNKFINNLSDPIITTSLNLHGASPIVSNTDAEFFAENIVKDNYTLVKEELECSGSSSTFVMLNKDYTFTIMRAGRLADDVSRYLQSLSA